MLIVSSNVDTINKQLKLPENRSMRFM